MLKCRFCFNGSLDVNLIQGKIVLCDGIADGVVSSGAVGMIMQDDTLQEAALLFPLPASQLDFNAGKNVFQYMRSTRYNGTMLKGYIVFKSYIQF